MSDTTLNIAGAGINVAEKQYEALVNNLVNARSTGYKAVGAVVKSFPEFLAEIEKESLSNVQFFPSGTSHGPMIPKMTQVYADFSQGTTVVTNRNLDFAIEGEGCFFNVQTPSGIVFTRDGRFIVNSDGFLVTTIGSYPVLGENGPIIIPQGVKFEILPNGEISADGNIIDRIKITAFEKDSLANLEVAGGSFFRIPLNKEIFVKENANYQLRQGVVEVSNVKVIDEMMKMIALQKMHEANVNVAKARDTLLQRSIEIGTAIRQ